MSMFWNYTLKRIRIFGNNLKIEWCLLLVLGQRFIKHPGFSLFILSLVALSLAEKCKVNERTQLCI